MTPELVAIAATQSGLVTRRQAIDAGYREHQLRTLTGDHGGWVTVRRGVYVERELWDRPGVGGSRTEHGVKHHLSRVSPGEVRSVAGLPVAGLARTALDLAREHGFVHGAVACDSALRAGATFAELRHELVQMRNWPGITQAQAAVEHADAGAETAGETLARILVEELGIGRPETQFPVQLPSSVAWCDLRVGCHIFEFDGRLKYLPPERGGIATQPAQDVVWAERERQRLVCAEGLGMSRIIWDDFWGTARERAKQRLAAEYAVTLARFGSTLPPHLAEFARRMAGRRRPA